MLPSAFPLGSTGGSTEPARVGSSTATEGVNLDDARLAADGSLLYVLNQIDNRPTPVHVEYLHQPGVKPPNA